MSGDTFDNTHSTDAVIDDDRIAEARLDLATTIEGAEPHAINETPGDPDGLSKVGTAGVSFELRLNGQTIPLDDKDVNQIAPDDFGAFLERHRLAIEASEMDDAIRNALSQPGPGKALVRVRALDAD